MARKKENIFGGVTRNFRKKPSKLGRKKKISSKDELLLTLLKLRLGLTEKDLAVRFCTYFKNISNLVPSFGTSAISWYLSRIKTS